MQDMCHWFHAMPLEIISLSHLVRYVRLTSLDLDALLAVPLPGKADPSMRGPDLDLDPDPGRGDVTTVDRAYPSIMTLLEYAVRVDQVRARGDVGQRGPERAEVIKGWLGGRERKRKGPNESSMSS